MTREEIFKAFYERKDYGVMCTQEDHLVFSNTGFGDGTISIANLMATSMRFSVIKATKSCSEGSDHRLFNAKGNDASFGADLERIISRKAGDWKLIGFEFTIDDDKPSISLNFLRNSPLIFNQPTFCEARLAEWRDENYGQAQLIDDETMLLFELGEDKAYILEHSRVAVNESERFFDTTITEIISGVKTRRFHCAIGNNCQQARWQVFNYHTPTTLPTDRIA